MAARSLVDPFFLEQYAATLRFRLGRPAGVSFTPDGRVLFMRSEPRSFVRSLFELDVTTGAERLLVTAEQLLGGGTEELSAEERARRERLRAAERGITTYTLSPDGEKLLIPLSGRLFLVDRRTLEPDELTRKGGPTFDARFSPDGRWVSFVRDGDLWLLELATQREIRLTTRESEKVTWGLAEYVAQEEMHRHQGYWWSPDSDLLLVQRTDVTGLEELHVSDLLHPERPPTASAYPRAGMANADVRLAICPIESRSTTWVAWDQAQYPYLATVRWERGAPATLVVQDRKQSKLLIVTVNPVTGITRAIHSERDTDWLNLDQDMPRWLPDGSAFLWTSERGGDWQLELRAADGRQIRTITPRGFGYDGLLGLDMATKTVWVRGSADPVETHIWKIPLDPADGLPEQLSTERGVHSAVLGSGSTFVHVQHTLEGRWRAVVRRPEGPAIQELRSVAEAPPFLPTLELRRVGPHALAAVILRPRDFDARHKYPVIVSVYGGPHSQMVTAAPHDYLLAQWLADHGFVVISVDGRGTPRRGRSFERAIRGSFVDVPLEDQVAALESILGAEPVLDASRVGIYGWSFGGYLSAMAVLLRPDIFRAAVAGAPVTDWLDYDTHYTERYLGLPAEAKEAYQRSSVLTYADRLERPLLILHGTLDDNVYLSHSVKLSDALFRAGKHHELQLLPGLTHMVPEPLMTRRLYERIAAFFLEHLSSGRAIEDVP